MKLYSVIKQNIKQNILYDLFHKRLKELEQRKQKLAEENYHLQIKEYLPIIKQLPIELVSMGKHYSISIKYQSPKGSYYGKNNKLDVDEKWYYYCKDIMYVFIQPNGYRNNYVEQKLLPELRPKAAEICEDWLKCSKEEEKMEKYLDTVLDNVVTTKQLREIFPSALHKYIPPEPPKKNRKRNIKEEITIDAPKELSRLLTEKLIEE